MENIGTYLIKGRKEKGLSREDIARITRIPLKFITALEEEDFDSLPEMVFVRGFVRTYCSEVGLSPDPILSQLKRDGQSKPVTPVLMGSTTINPMGMTTGTGTHKRQSRMGIALILLVFVLGLIFGVITLTRTTGFQQDMSQVTNPAPIHYPVKVKSGIEDTGTYFF